METNTLYAGIYSDLTIGHSLVKLLGKTSLDVSCIPKISPVPSETVYIIVPHLGTCADFWRLCPLFRKRGQENLNASLTMLEPHLFNERSERRNTGVPRPFLDFTGNRSASPVQTQAPRHQPATTQKVFTRKCFHSLRHCCNAHVITVVYDANRCFGTSAIKLI